jgi:hypothetical protein
VVCAIARQVQGSKRAYPSEAAYHVDLCRFDMADPSASLGRKRRAREALVHWTAELERIATPKGATPC